MADPDYAVPIAERVVGNWLPDTSDDRSVVDLVAAGVRAGYALGLGVNS